MGASYWALTEIASQGYDNDNEDVLEGIRRAAVTLQYHELLQQHGHLLEEPQALKPSVLEQLERAQEASHRLTGCV